MKEDRDKIEREVKFSPSLPEADILRLVRLLIREEWLLIKKPPRTIVDVFLDTKELVLLRNNITLRLRKRRVNPGWSVTYKPEPTPSVDYVERREVQTSLKLAEALRCLTGDTPGLAFSLAKAKIEELTSSQDLGPISPVVHAESRRHCFAIRRGSAEDLSRDELGSNGV